MRARRLIFKERKNSIPGNRFSTFPLYFFKLSQFVPPRINFGIKHLQNNGGSPGLVVMGDDSCSEGCGFKYLRRILDGNLDIFSH